MKTFKSEMISLKEWQFRSLGQILFYSDILFSQIDLWLFKESSSLWPVWCLKQWDKMTALPSMNTLNLFCADDPQRISTGSFRVGNKGVLISWWYEAVWPSCSTAVSEDFSTDELGFSIFVCVEIPLSYVLK